MILTEEMIQEKIMEYFNISSKPIISSEVCYRKGYFDIGVRYNILNSLFSRYLLYLKFDASGVIKDVHIIDETLSEDIKKEFIGNSLGISKFPRIVKDRQTGVGSYKVKGFFNKEENKYVLVEDFTTLYNWFISKPYGVDFYNNFQLYCGEVEHTSASGDHGIKYYKKCKSGRIVLWNFLGNTHLEIEIDTKIGRVTLRNQQLPLNKIKLFCEKKDDPEVLKYLFIYDIVDNDMRRKTTIEKLDSNVYLVSVKGNKHFYPKDVSGVYDFKFDFDNHTVTCCDFKRSKKTVQGMERIYDRAIKNFKEDL